MTELKPIPSVSKDDLTAIKTMDKDSVEAFCIQHFSIDLDKRKKVAVLRKQATELVKGALGQEPVEQVQEESIVVEDSQYILDPRGNKPRKRALFGQCNPEWVACDAAGKPL
mgnify:CR=1 FL=1